MRRHEGDVTKLPKWAQSKIRVLEMRLKEAHEELAEGDEASNTILNPYSGALARKLGVSPSVAFLVAGGEIRCRVDGGVLDVLVIGRDTAIHPLSGNHFQVRA